MTATLDDLREARATQQAMDKRIAELAQAVHESGVEWREIAAALGMSQEALRKMRRRNGL